MNIEEFIKELRSTDEYIRTIYLNGGCYKFYILLSKMYKNIIPYISNENDHIISRYKDRYYDIDGEVKNIKGYRELNESDIDMVEKWSFRKNNVLVLKECPYCDEPLLIDI